MFLLLVTVIVVRQFGTSFWKADINLKFMYKSQKEEGIMLVMVIITITTITLIAATLLLMNFFHARSSPKHLTLLAF